MTYIDYINAFWESAMVRPLTAGQISLYFALLNLCNKNYWQEWFPASSQLLSALTGLSRSGILKARKELQESGLIDYQQQGTKSCTYKLMTKQDPAGTKPDRQEPIQVGIVVADRMQDRMPENSQTNVLVSKSEQERVQESNRTGVLIEDSKQDSVQESNQTNVLIAKSKQDSVQESDRTDVLIAKSKQDSKQESAQALYSINNIIGIYKDIRQKTPPVSPLQHVEEFLSAYPVDDYNRYLTEREYATLLMTGAITERDLVQCAQNYAETCQIRQTPRRYIKRPENFLREFAFEQYLPGRYRKDAAQTAAPKASNKFNDFPQREYTKDKISAMERQLLGM